MNKRPILDRGALDKRPAFGTLGDVKVFSAQRGRSALALLVVGALLACHGVFGGFHLFPGALDAASPNWGHGGTPLAGEHPSHAGAAVGGHGAEGTGGHPSTSEYAAVLLAVFVGTVLGLLLCARTPRPVSEARLEADGFVLYPGVPALARGPDLRAFLQVFRL